MKKMNDAVSNNFIWSEDPEPHGIRRIQILKKYPEIRLLMGHDPMSKWICILLVGFQIMLSLYVHKTNIIVYICTVYMLGATITQSLFLAVHESSHNLIFEKPYNNKLFSLFLNLPIVIPFSIAFRHYHLDHHNYQGIDGIDTDLPTNFELSIIRNSVMKFLWLTFQIIIYAVRPIIHGQNKLRYSFMLFANIIFQFFSNFFIWYFHGLQPFVYLLLCLFLAGGLHPCAGHFLSEHYNFKNVKQETFSYYGNLNKLTWNVGYHNEHHDFPYISGLKLPLVKKIAPEFYINLITCESWTLTIYNYITDRRIGLFCRIRRHKKFN